MNSASAASTQNRLMSLFGQTHTILSALTAFLSWAHVLCVSCVQPYAGRNAACKNAAFTCPGFSRTDRSRLMHEQALRTAMSYAAAASCTAALGSLAALHKGDPAWHSSAPDRACLQQARLR